MFHDPSGVAGPRLKTTDLEKQACAKMVILKIASNLRLKQSQKVDSE